VFQLHVASAGILRNIDKLEKVRLLEARAKLRENLPHLHGYPFYKWSRELFESFADQIFLSASNQSTKSSTAIRKCINWATDPKLWPKISKRTKPTLFFYFLPSKVLASREIHHKWIPEFLPRNEMKSHPQYGWKLNDTEKKLSIEFNTGVEVVFLGYSQGKADLLSLASSSPSAIFIDEECPPELFPEIAMRLEATKGKLFFLATPDKCYQFYKDIFEGRTKLPGALIKTVSMYECLFYEDGSPGLYTKEDVERRKALLGSQAEILKRVYGRYATPEGLAYESFRREINVKPLEPHPIEWHWYCGIDIGSGGSNHPAAITFVAVRPDYRKARVILAWRGGKDQQTTNSDILDKFVTLKHELLKDRPLFGAFYDFAAKDFEILAIKSGIGGLQKANKDREFGKGLLNSLFKNDMLDIDDIADNQGLINELESLRNDAHKRHAVDDSIDATRYATSLIPFDFSHITGKSLPGKPVFKPEVKTDREEYQKWLEELQLNKAQDDDLELWNSLVED
jgi:hypothetical protein